MSSYEVSFDGLGIHGIYIEPVAFRLFSIPVYWYSILMTAAVFLCLFLALRKAKYCGLRQDDVLDSIIAIVFFMIIGARLYYVAFSWNDYKDNLTAIFSTRSGGLAFYGGVLGGLFGIWLTARIKKIRFPRLLDFLAVYVPLGQAIGRWGNFINQEAFGTNTSLPWGMYSAKTQRYLSALNMEGLDPTQPVHPTFLYEFIGNMIIFFILIRVRRLSRRPYEVTVWYLLLYGILRFLVEGIRTDALYIGATGLRVSQLLSLLIAAFAAAMLLVFRHREKMRYLAPLYAKYTDDDSKDGSDDTPSDRS